MKFISLPGINGLGHTSSARDFAQLLIPNIEEIQLNQDDLQEQQSQIYQEVKLLLSEYNSLFVIGGDHSISYPIGQAFIEKQSNPALIVFDAHADCMPPLKEPTHEEWLRALLERSDIPTMVIGLRKAEQVEKEFLEKHNVKIITPKQIKDNLQQAINQIIDFTKNKNIYISFDIDALDPSIAPATYYTEPSGLTLEQAKQLIKAIPKSQIKLIDLVEIHTNHPEKKLDLTIRTAKQLINNLAL